MTGSGVTPRGAPHRKGLRNTRARTRAHAHTHVYAHTHMHVCTRVHTRVHAHTYPCTSVYALVHAHTRVCTHANGTDMRKRGREGPSDKPITGDSLGQGIQRNLGGNDQGPCRKRRRVSVQHTCRLRGDAGAGGQFVLSAASLLHAEGCVGLDEREPGSREAHGGLSCLNLP